MTNQTPLKKREGNPIKLVWLITLLSFFVGVFMVYLVWSTLTDIRTEREKFFELKEDSNLVQTKLESSLAAEKSEITDLLEADADTDIQVHDYHLAGIVHDYRHIISSPVLVPAFEQLEKEVNSLLNIKSKLTWWASAYKRVVPRIPLARKEVEIILAQMLETVDKAEGQQRLEQAAKIRQIKRDALENHINITISAFNELAAPNDFSIIRRDIMDLVQLSERLHTIAEADNLADLKDNKIRTLLARIRFNALLAEGEKSAGKSLLSGLIENYETALFGQGYSIDNDHQTIILGYDGIYGFILDRLKLEKEKDTLRSEVTHIYESTVNSFNDIITRAETVTEQEAIKVEKVLGQTWRTMVIIWLVTSLIYAMLAYEIIMAAKQQIKEIEDSNIELETMTGELRKSEERLHRLSSDLFAVQENERRRISLELHDELGQSMAALKLQVGAIARRLGHAEPEELKTDCDEMRNNINEIIENVRRLARDLSPVVLDDLGLQAAIEYLVNNFAKIYTIEVKYQHTDINHLFNEESQRIIYRILQEALTNIAKHAQAKSVSLNIEEKEHAVQFTIRDNGRGFNVQKTLDQKGAARGMGLQAMLERVRILGGWINIVSRPGIDTTVTFTVPTR
jgi:signal transduction histidine kinase